MAKSLLVEIISGVWADPNNVTTIAVSKEDETVLSLLEKSSPEIAKQRFRVNLRFTDGNSLSWPHPNRERAHAAAKYLVERINELRQEEC